MLKDQSAYLIVLNKICMDAILKAFSKVMNENGRNKVFTMIKQLKCESTAKTLTFHLIIIFM